MTSSDSSTSGAATIVVPRRFRGPPRSGNGGYACALLARHVGAPASEVTLRSPPPLDRPMEVRSEGERALLLDGEHLVAEAAATTLDVAAPRVSAGEAIEAAGRFRGFEQNPFPSCFACGPERAPGDGLRIFTGRVEGSDVVAAPWTPAADLAGADGIVAEPVVWAAIDCPSGWAHVREPAERGARADGRADPRTRARRRGLRRRGASDRRRGQPSLRGVGAARIRRARGRGRARDVDRGRLDRGDRADRRRVRRV